MDKAVLEQLAELTRAFNKIGLRPLICGGLAVYLLFHDRSSSLRVTSDVDLMISASQAQDEAKRRAIADTITGSLQYVVREGGEHFRFTGKAGRELDILAPPIEGITSKGGRVKLVPSKLHGRETIESRFIEEDLRSIELAGLIPDWVVDESLVVDVPSPTNMLILKLFAFADRDSDARRNDERAQAHAFDVYVISSSAERDDFLEGRRFVERHRTDEIVQKARAIVEAKFASLDTPGWRYVMASAVWADRPIEERREMADGARRRLLRWFEESDATPQE